jgi:hypothetical protein
MTKAKIATLSEPFQPFSQVPRLKRMKYRDSNHCPSNKCVGTVDAIAELEITRHEVVAGHDVGYVNISVTEFVHHPNGRTVSRNISIDLSMEHAARIAKFINKGA